MSGDLNSTNGSPEFPPTRWSVVGRAGADETRVVADAMNTLAHAYWYPIYAFLRRSGRSPEDAQDQTQGFFEYLMETGLICKADPAKGRFRTYLLGSLKYFLSSERRRQVARKRGGGLALVSLDDPTAEGRYVLERPDTHTPETLYELSWARALLDQARAAVEEEYIAAGKRELFLALQPSLRRESDAASYVEIARVLGKTEEAIKSAALRLRQRFQQCLREQISKTVSSTTEVEEEVRHLFAVLAG